MQMYSAKKLTFYLSRKEQEYRHLESLFSLLRFLISLITLIFSTVLKEKELPLYASCIAVMLGCLRYFIIDFNLGQNMLSDCGSMLLDSGIWSKDTIFEK